MSAMQPDSAAFTPCPGVMVFADGRELPFTAFRIDFDTGDLTLKDPLPPDTTLTISVQIDAWPWDKLQRIKPRAKSNEPWRRQGKRKGKHGR